MAPSPPARRQPALAGRSKESAKGLGDLRWPFKPREVTGTFDANQSRLRDRCDHACGSRARVPFSVDEHGRGLDRRQLGRQIVCCDECVHVRLECLVDP
jgi:hypothetical protein